LSGARVCRWRRATRAQRGQCQFRGDVERRKIHEVRGGHVERRKIHEVRGGHVERRKIREVRGGHATAWFYASDVESLETRSSHEAVLLVAF
jgi:hypothetical protein